MDCPVSR